MTLRMAFHIDAGMTVDISEIGNDVIIFRQKGNIEILGEAADETKCSGRNTEVVEND